MSTQFMEMFEISAVLLICISIFQFNPIASFFLALLFVASTKATSV